MAIKSGFSAVKEAIDKASQRGQGSGGFLPYIVWKDDRNGEGRSYEKTIRFLTDDVVPCKIYEYIPCKDGKLRDFIIPSSVGLEGEDWVQKSGVKVQQFGNKNNLIDPKPRDMTLGLVVLREEKVEMVDGRRVLSYKDKMEEVTYEKNGQKVTETRPVFGAVKQSNANFWSVVAGYWSRYGTIVDRDYSITRNGNGVDTNYTIIPCDPIEGLRDPEDVEKTYKPPTSLVEIVENLASADRAKKLLLGEGSEQGSSESKTSSEAKAGGSGDETEFDDFRKQLIDQG